MSDHTLHLPKTFLHSDSVRSLARALAEGVAAEGPASSVERVSFIRYPADFYLYRMWLDWSREGTAIRPFLKPASMESIQSDPLVALIEEWCDWHGPKGGLIAECLRLNVLCITIEPPGLELRGFAEHNAHLAPGHLGQHALGGKRRAINKRLKSILDLVPAQLELAEAAGALGPLAAATDAQKRQALGFVMALDGALGRDQRRPQDYPADLLKAALEVVQKHPQKKLGEVLLEAAENAGLAPHLNDPDLIIKRLLA